MCVQKQCVNETLSNGWRGNRELFMRTDVDGKKLFLCLKVFVAAIGPPNIVTVWCIYCSSNNTPIAPPLLGVSIKFILFYLVPFLFILLQEKSEPRPGECRQGSCSSCQNQTQTLPSQARVRQLLLLPW